MKDDWRVGEGAVDTGDWFAADNETHLFVEREGLLEWKGEVDQQALRRGREIAKLTGTSFEVD